MKDRFNISLLDVEKFVKKNDCEEITNPIFFRNGIIPTDDGLLSLSIFGISRKERGGTFAYIDLGTKFLNPLVYTTLCSLNSKVKDIVYGTKKFKIDDKGELYEDELGNTGLDWLVKNLDKIKFKTTDSNKRDISIQFLEVTKKIWVMDKLVIIPAYYRDVNSVSEGMIDVGEINKLYAKIMVSVRSLKETQDYGFDLSDTLKGRIQDLILEVYKWFTNEPNLTKKHGSLRKANLSKTTDRGSRLVIAGPSVDGETYKDLKVDIKHSLIPLASILVNVLDFIIFGCRRFFDNEFLNGEYKYLDKKGNIINTKIKDYEIQFSDDRIKKEIERFIKGFSNRLIPIEIITEDGKKLRMKFKGRKVDPENMDKADTSPLIDRDFTWCDLFYMMAEEACKDKHAFITRFPLETFYGQFPTKVLVNSTRKTEPIWYDNTLYENYPYIRQELIGSNTSNLFVDTLQMSNLMLKGIGGDYDGDMVSVKVSYLNESNKEMEAYLNSKANIIGIDGVCIRESTNESIQAIYNLTKVLDISKLSNPVF